MRWKDHPSFLGCIHLQCLTSAEKWMAAGTKLSSFRRQMINACSLPLKPAEAASHLLRELSTHLKSKSRSFTLFWFVICANFYFKYVLTCWISFNQPGLQITQNPPLPPSDLSRLCGSERGSQTMPVIRSSDVPNAFMFGSEIYCRDNSSHYAHCLRGSKGDGVCSASGGKMQDGTRRLTCYCEKHQHWGVAMGWKTHADVIWAMCRGRRGIYGTQISVDHGSCLGVTRTKWETESRRLSAGVAKS